MVLSSLAVATCAPVGDQHTSERPRSWPVRTAAGSPCSACHRRQVLSPAADQSHRTTATHTHTRRGPRRIRSRVGRGHNNTEQPRARARIWRARARAVPEEASNWPSGEYFTAETDFSWPCMTERGRKVHGAVRDDEAMEGRGPEGEWERPIHTHSGARRALTQASPNKLFGQSLFGSASLN